MTGWDVMIAREREKQQKEWDAEGRPALRDQEIVDPGHEIEWEKMTRQSHVGKIAHLAADHGWIVKVGAAHYRTPERWEKNAVVGGQVKEHRWVQAISPDGTHHISVSNELKLIDGWVVSDLDEVKIHLMEYGVEE